MVTLDNIERDTFSQSFSKFKTLSKHESNSSQISQVKKGKGGKKPPKGKSEKKKFKLAQVTFKNGQFVPEAKMYRSAQWKKLNNQQRKAVFELKRQKRWVNGAKPPPGYKINPEDGKPIPVNSTVSAAQFAASEIDDLSTPAWSCDCACQ